MTERIELLIKKLNNEGATVEILIQIITYYLYSGNPNDAIEYIEMIGVFNENHLYNYFYGVVEEKNNDFVAALDYYTRSYEADTSFYFSLYAKGRMEEELGETEKAIDTFKLSLDNYPDDHRDVYVKLTSILEVHKRYEEALDYLNAAIDEGIEDTDIYFNAGVCYMRKEDYEKAIYYYLDAIEDPDVTKYAYFNLGVCYKELNDFDEALIYYDKALENEVEEELVNYNIACIYAIKNLSNDAIKLLKISFSENASYLEYAKNDEELINNKEVQEYIKNY